MVMTGGLIKFPLTSQKGSMDGWMDESSLIIIIIIFIIIHPLQPKT
jgi:hypothetical protein